jgi:alginate O-acetyltransferase complex protein AlgJ
MKRPTSLAILATLVINATTAAAADSAKLLEIAAARKSETPVVRGTGDWFYLPTELRHLAAGEFWGERAAGASQAARPENADPLPAILDFRDQLKQQGVRLILVPVPAKAVVYPGPLTGDGLEARARLDDVHQAFFAKLRGEGVEVIDLLPDFLAAAAEGGEPLYCRTDSHWAGRGVNIAARKIAAALNGVAWPEGAPHIKTDTTETKIEIQGDLARLLKEGTPGPESLSLRFVNDAATGKPVAPSPESPLVLLGDSHTLVFHSGEDMLATGAGLGDHLAHDLGMPVDLIGVRGSGATPARVNLMRRSRANPDYLSGKKAVVWCFTVREFTESTGWSKVPLGPQTP